MEKNTVADTGFQKLKGWGWHLWEILNIISYSMNKNRHKVIYVSCKKKGLLE